MLWGTISSSPHDSRTGGGHWPPHGTCQEGGSYGLRPGLASVSAATLCRRGTYPAWSAAGTQLPWGMGATSTILLCTASPAPKGRVSAWVAAIAYVKTKTVVLPHIPLSPGKGTTSQAPPPRGPYLAGTLFSLIPDPSMGHAVPSARGLGRLTLGEAWAGTHRGVALPNVGWGHHLRCPLSTTGALATHFPDERTTQGRVPGPRGAKIGSLVSDKVLLSRHDVWLPSSVISWTPEGTPRDDGHATSTRRAWAELACRHTAPTLPIFASVPLPSATGELGAWEGYTQG